MTGTLMDLSAARGLLRRHAKTFLTTFACILVAVAVILGLVYTSFQSIVLDSVARQHRDFAGQLDAFSGILSTAVQNYGMQIFYAPSALQLREGTATSKMEQVYAMRELGSYVSSNDFVDSIQIYNRESGYVYSTDSNVISAPVGQYADRNAAELFSSLTADLRMRPIQRTAFPEDPVRTRQYFSFLFFETTSEDEPTGGVLMINVDSKRYLDMLLSISRQGDCALLDETGRLLVAGSADVEDKVPLFLEALSADSQDKSGYLLKKTNGQQTVCLHFRLDSSRWQYLKIMELRDCVPRLMELKSALVAGILIGFSLLALCSLGVLLFLYFPVYQVRTSLHNVGISRGGGLAGQVSQLARQSEAYQKANALQALLEGRSSGAPQNLAAPFTLLLLETEHPAPIRQQLLEQYPAALTYHQPGCEVVLFSGATEDELNHLFGQLADTPGVSCFCGRARASVSEIPACYQILCEMRRQRIWNADNTRFSEQDFKPGNPHSSFTDQMAASLASALRGTDLKQIRAVWEEIRAALQADRSQEQLFAFRRIAALLETQLSSLKPLAGDDFWTQLKDIRQLDARFQAAFQRIVQNNQALHKNRVDQLSLQVMQHISRRYSDSDLSPTRIADEMGMSSAYLGRMFRESTRISINQYINQTRVRRAAELLRNTDDPVETIAGAVGFSNPKYFYVVFKNLTGSTPLQFRKSPSSPLPAPLPEQAAASGQ